MDNRTVISTFEWTLPTESGYETIVDYYRISFSPRPLSHPGTNLVFSSPWTVTLHANIEYTVGIIAGNCVGETDKSTTRIGIN